MTAQYVVQTTPAEKVRCFSTIERGDTTLSAWTNRDYWWYQLSVVGPNQSRWLGVALMNHIDRTPLEECWVCVRDELSGDVVSLQGGRDIHAALVRLTELLDQRAKGEMIDGVWPRPQIPYNGLTPSHP